LWERLHASISDVEICGPALEEVDGEGRPLRLPNNVNVAIEGVDGEAVMLRSPEIAVSSGAACSSVEPGPSHVMLALGLPEDRARSTLRFGLGRWTTADEVDRAAAAIARSVAQLRALAT
jgi:cysteine desulfurase